MAAGMRLLDIPFLDGNMFKQVIMSCTRDIVINFMFFCKIWSDIHISLSPLLYRWISRCPICDHLRHMCVDGMVLKIMKVFRFIDAMEIVDGQAYIFILGLRFL